jgi:FixJ family two-component response regulator
MNAHEHAAFADRNLMPIKPTVAIVDDNHGLLGALGRLLSACGYEPERYASAEEFLIALPNSRAIAIIVDIHLGNDSGFQFVEKIRREHGIGIPIIFMTANGNEEIKRRALEAGCLAYLIKPFAPNDLMHALIKVTPARGS